VEKILEELEINNKPAIRVFNKADRFPDKDLLKNLSTRFDAIAISALDKTTLFALLQKIECCGLKKSTPEPPPAGDTREVVVTVAMSSAGGGVTKLRRWKKTGAS
jgi:50S ribosomal subunit-associated GTPase HflX